MNGKTAPMSRILKNAHASAKRLHDAGFMNDATMREFDASASHGQAPVEEKSYDQPNH